MTNATEKQVSYLTSLMTERRRLIDLYRTYWTQQDEPVAAKRIETATVQIGLIDSVDISSLTASEASAIISALKLDLPVRNPVLTAAIKPDASATIKSAAAYEMANRETVKEFSLTTMMGVLRRNGHI